MTTRTIGILVADSKPPFQERKYYKRLHDYADKCKMAIVVIPAHALDWTSFQVEGYRYDAGRGVWQKGQFPLPDIIYDRMFYEKVRVSRKAASNIKKIRELKPSRLLGNPIAGKWNMQHILSRHQEIKSYLPETARYCGPHTLKSWLRKRRNAVLKPVSGSHGCGIVLIQAREAGRYQVMGRDADNSIIERQFNTASSLYAWIDPFTGHRPYIIQQYLKLLDHHKRNYDIRALVQKNERGLWGLTGTAVRIGSFSGFTSNLRGGGKAVSTSPYLHKMFSPDKAEQLYQTICHLSAVIPSFLESYFGRLAELGIDFGIDKDGRVWVLEVNSKPGRSVFEYIGDRDAGREAIVRPLNYARYLVDRQLGG